MENEAKISFLKDEYLLLQKFYEDFDARVMTIKGWSSTVAIAAIGLGFYQSNYLWLFAAAASIMFWLLEAIWKNFQYSYAPRIQEIETAFRESNFDNIQPFQIYSTWFEGYKNHGSRLLRLISMPLIWFPHLITAVAGILLFIFFRKT